MKCFVPCRVLPTRIVLELVTKKVEFLKSGNLFVVVASVLAVYRAARRSKANVHATTTASHCATTAVAWPCSHER